MQKKPFAELGLSPELLKAVAQMGFEEASPIQSEAIPVLLTGRDVVGQSQTGSGKTAAFALPAIERVDSALRSTQAIILCPTRELVMQVAEEVAKLAAFKRGVRELPIYGGASYERQFRGLKAGAHIVIGTPGRVIDHLNRGTLSMEHVRFVVLDEADRMLDMGFRDEIEEILSKAPTERQTVLFSATIPPSIQQLIKKFTREPEHIRIADQALTVPAIEQVYYEVDRRSKLEVLCRLIDLQDIKFSLIFCATKAMVDELMEHLLARGYAADRLHGDMAQTMRERVMRRFREHKVELLVATDVAARGLDVDDIEVVFNYDLPHDAEDYVHRIGRTGRAGRAGRAITFVAGREIWRLEQFIRVTKGRIRREKVPSQAEVEQRQASRIFDTLREVLERNEFKRHDAVIDELLEGGHTPTDIASALIHLLSTETARAGERISEDDPKPERRAEYPKYEARRTPASPQKERAPRRGSSEPETRSSRSDDERPRPVTRSAKGALSRDEPPTRSHEPGMVRLAFNIGEEHRIKPGDIVGFLTAMTKSGREAIGAIHILPRNTLVDVAEPAVPAVLRLNNMRLKGRKLVIAPATH